jgi:hypothetical protein
MATRPEGPGSWSKLAGSTSTAALSYTHTNVPATHAAAGWYAYPTASHRMRWWDGHTWTGFTSQ